MEACVELLQAVDSAEYALSWVDIRGAHRDDDKVDVFLEALGAIERAGVRIEFLFKQDAINAAVALKAIWYDEVQHAAIELKPDLDWNEVFGRERDAYIKFLQAARQELGTKGQLSDQAARRIYETPRRKRGPFWQAY